MTYPIKLDIGEIPLLELDREEAQSLYNEMKNQWISRDNPMTLRTFEKIEKFLNELAKRDSSTT